MNLSINIFIAFATIIFQFCSLATGQSPKLPEIIPIEIPGGRLEIELPDLVEQVKVGGAGRYLLLHFKSSKTIGLFDVNEAQIVHSFPAEPTDIKFAVGANKLITVSAEAKEIAVYDLESRKQINSKVFENEKGVGQFVLGSASMGPAFIRQKTKRSSTIPGLETLDLETLELSNFDYNDTRRGISISWDATIRPSSNGNTIAIWTRTTSTTCHSFVQQSDGIWKPHIETTYAYDHLPSSDGNHVFTPIGIFTSQLKKAYEDEKAYLIPAAHGPFYMAVSTPQAVRSWNKRNPDSPKKPKTQIKMLGHDVGFGEFFELEIFPDENIALNSDRAILIPRAEVFIELAFSNSKLILHKWEMDKQLADSGVEYLFVVSQPPTRVKAGDEYEYQLDVKSKSGGVHYDLLTAPDGMTISNEGIIRWNPNKESPERNTVLATVNNKSGKQVFHSFVLHVDGTSGAPEKVESLADNRDKNPSKTDPVRANDEYYRAIKFPGAVDKVVVGAGGRLMFFHIRSLGKIAVVDSLKAKVVRYLSVPPRITIAAGRDYLFVVDVPNETISRINLTTFETEQTRSLPFPGTIKHMAMGCNSNGPFLVRTENLLVNRIGTFDFMKVSMDMLKSKWPVRMQERINLNNTIRPTADGKMFFVDTTGHVGLDGKKVLSTKEMAEKYRKVNFGGRGPIFPSYDGNFFAFSGKIMDANFKVLSGQSTNLGMTIPSLNGPYFLSYSGEGAQVRLYRFGEDVQLARLENIKSPFPKRSVQFGVQGHPSDRVWFLSDIGVITTLDPIKNQLIWQRINVVDEIKKSGVDYLFVLSAPPATGEVGETYRYQTDVQSSSDKVSFKLESAPKGMKVSKSGEITWEIPDTDKPFHSIALQIRDSSRQKTLHTFVIEIPSVRKSLQSQDPEFASHNAKDVEKPEKEFAMRVWKDASGKHSVRAKFVRLVDQSNLVLLTDAGKKIEMSLSRLAKDDIYAAVQCELELRNLWNASSNDTSSK